MHQGWKSFPRLIAEYPLTMSVKGSRIITIAIDMGFTRQKLINSPLFMKLQ